MAGGLLVLFLGMYSWNQRTHTLDDIAANVGLEMSGTVLGTFDSVKGSVMDAWRRYVDLVGVREENERLRAQVAELQARIVSHGEDLAELARLRELVQLPVDSAWKPVGARILAGRMGPNAIQDSITINRGYTSGARPGTPIVTNMGLVGRVLRASPHAATVLLITDPGSRIAVFAQQSRSAGILSGQGLEQPLEVGAPPATTSICPTGPKCPTCCGVPNGSAGCCPRAAIAATWVSSIPWQLWRPTARPGKRRYRQPLPPGKPSTGPESTLTSWISRASSGASSGSAGSQGSRSRSSRRAVRSWACRRMRSAFRRASSRIS